jgi:ferredoxin-NADP reductase
LKIGDRVEIAGPKGKFCLIPGKIPPKMLFIAGGSGITPLMSMTRWLCDVSANVDIRFFNSVRTPDDIIFQKEIELLTSHYKMFTPLLLTFTRGISGNWMGLTGRVTRPMLEMLAPDIHDRHIYMCGPEGFMDAVIEILRDMNFDLANLHTESFGGIRTSVADKLPPAIPVSQSGAAALLPMEEQGMPAGTIKVEFARSGKKGMTDGAMPLLDLAEAHDVDIGYACRAGVCGECKVRLLQGRVQMACEDGLRPDEKAAGYILTCVGTPVADCVLDA